VEALAALKRGLEIAEQLHDLRLQLRLLGTLNIFYIQGGEFNEALAVSHRYAAIANGLNDRNNKLMSSWILGTSYHASGDQFSALARCETSCYLLAGRGTHALRFDDDHRTRARIALARTLWLRGRPRRAAEIATDAIAQAAEPGHPAVLCMTQIFAVPIFLWAGDQKSAEASVEQSLALATKHSLAPYRANVIGLLGSLAIRKGEVEKGMRLLLESLGILEDLRHSTLVPTLAAALAEGLAASGRHDEAVSTIDAAITRDERQGGSYYTPETWRVKADLLLSASNDSAGDAEKCLVRSLDWSRRQSALVWELRSATSLARLWQAQGRLSDAWYMLSPVYERFTEGFAFPDLQVAGRLLNTIEDDRPKLQRRLPQVAVASAGAARPY